MKNAGPYTSWMNEGFVNIRTPLNDSGLNQAFINGPSSAEEFRAFRGLKTVDVYGFVSVDPRGEHMGP